LKLLIVSQYFWPENFRINDLATELVERGHQVTVLTGQPNYPSGRTFPGYRWYSARQEIWKGMRIIRCPLIPRGNGGGFRLAINYLSFALSASLAATFMLKDRFDAIFVYEPSPITVALPALLLRKLRQSPVLLWVLDLWPESVAATGAVRSRLVLHLIGMLVRFIYARCDRILVQSKGFVEHVLNRGGHLESVRYFPSWAEPVFASPPATPIPFQLPQGFTVVFAGNIGAAQGFAAILEGAELTREQKDIHWILVGDGRLADWVHSEIQSRQLQDTVHTPGSFPLDSMPALFEQADTLLVSLRPDPIFSLTIPAKIQSYLACGRPIIGMLDGEGAEVLRASGAALVGPAGDANALARNILTLKNMSPGCRKTMGTLGRRYYLDHFERDRLVTELEKWFEEAALNRQSGGTN
jgi:colanic acid biosynthesis glycosyl transferase WcaI